MKKTKLEYCWWILPLLFILIIFWFSTKPADVSDSQSLWIVYIIQDFLEDINIAADIHFLNHIVRKCAHFSEYTLLGILVMYANHRASINKWYLLCFMVPVLDEYIQSFSVGRSCQISDMLLDSSGIITGLLIVFLIVKHLKKSVNSHV